MTTDELLAEVKRLGLIGAEHPSWGGSPMFVISGLIAELITLRQRVTELEGDRHGATYHERQASALWQERYRHAIDQGEMPRHAAARATHAAVRYRETFAPAQDDARAEYERGAASALHDAVKAATEGTDPETRATPRDPA